MLNRFSGFAQMNLFFAGASEQKPNVLVPLLGVPNFFWPKGNDQSATRKGAKTPGKLLQTLFCAPLDKRQEL